MNASNIHRGRGLRRTIKSDITLLYRAMKHPKTSWLVKTLIGALILYIISPIDLIPGWLVGIGILDDVGVTVLAIGRIKKLIPERLKDELTGKIIVKN